MYDVKQLASISDGRRSKLIVERKFPTLVYDKIFPVAKVDSVIVPRLEFGNDGIKLMNNLKRAEFGPMNIIRPSVVNYYSDRLDEYEAAFPIDWKQTAEIEAMAFMSKRFARDRAAKKAWEILMLNREYEVMSMVTDSALYDVDHEESFTSSTSWATSTNVMITDVATAADIIYESCGHYPNVGVFGSQKAFINVATKSYFLDRIKYGGTTNMPAKVTMQAMAEILNLEEIVVGQSSYDVNGTVSALWPDCFLLAYVNRDISNNAMEIDDEKSFGVTLEYRNCPFVDRVPEGVNDKGFAKVEYLRATSLHKHIGLNYDAAFLFKNTTLTT